MAERLEELKVWQRAREFWTAINEILDRPALQKDRRLRDQLSDAADSMVANISEGFEQPTDRAFARYLYISKASTAEARTRLSLAENRSYITDTEFKARDALGDEVARMTTGLIKYIIKSDRRDRGLGSRHRPNEADD
jgi:four helix bundle protein